MANDRCAVAWEGDRDGNNKFEIDLRGQDVLLCTDGDEAFDSDPNSVEGIVPHIVTAGAAAVCIRGYATGTVTVGTRIVVVGMASRALGLIGG